MKTKVTFIADTHHFSPTLADGGRAYQLRSGSDQKCLLETGAIIDAVFDVIAKSDTDAVMIVGDITDDGERVSHEEFREKCYKLQRSKPVYIVTATHDWCCDGNPRSFSGDTVSTDVPVVPVEELREFYRDFGIDKAKEEYITHLGEVSYVADIGENVRLLAINDDQNGKGHSGYTEAHFDWIEEQIKKAKADGKVLLAMEHHLIMPHIHPLISGHGMCVGDREYVASRLADAGLKYMFTGHSHVLRVSDFVSEKGNKIFQVNIGAAVGYPSPIVNVTVDGEDVSIETVHAPTFEYNGTQDTLKYTAKHFFEMFDRALTGAAGKDTKEFADRMDALGIDGKKAAKFHPFVKLPARYLLKVRVRGAYRLANALTLGRVIDKRDAKEFADRPVLDFIHDIMLAAVGGTPERHSADSAYCRLVKQVASIPSFFVRKNKALRELPEVAELIVTGGKYNAYKCDLK
ncbi:MAG: metallophosphoesterase [Clostridia bacterium]|nr:metallophosphoesterase [Clostridia bacterium]